MQDEPERGTGRRPHPPIFAGKDPRAPAPPSIADDWLERLEGLTPAIAATLLSMARTLCPHDRAPEDCYRRVIIHLDRQAAADDGFAGLCAEGAAVLDSAQPLPFRELSEGGRVAELRRIEGSRFFTAIQRGVVRRLYDDPAIWELCGFEGASHHLGGYRERGFDDLDWLPDPPKSVCEG